MIREKVLRELAFKWLEDARTEHARGNANGDAGASDSQNYAYGCEHTLERCVQELVAAMRTLPPSRRDAE